jgi:DNA polymerase
VTPAPYWLACGDYSQIEARVNPWLAGAEWKLDAFRRYDAGTGPDLYRVAAAGIYQIEVGAVSAQQRQIGKVGELALGFQGGEGALQAMAKAYRVTIPDDQEGPIKTAWREDNPQIVGLWKGLNTAAIDGMRAPIGTVTPVYTLDRDGARVFKTPLTFRRSRSALAMRLPSGRNLFYWNPVLRQLPTPWGRNWAVVYRSSDAVTGRWTEFNGYGGIFCENAVQATARDIMADALLALEDAGFPPCMTVHDEGVCPIPRDRFPTPARAAEEVRRIMVDSLAGCYAGLPVAVKASAALRYGKG